MSQQDLVNKLPKILKSTMSTSNDPDNLFQTRYTSPSSLNPFLLTNDSPSSSLAETSRKARKAPNTHGNPIRLPSKILAVIADPTTNGAVYLAESAGTARRVVLDVGEDIALLLLLPGVQDTVHG